MTTGVKSIRVTSEELRAELEVLYANWPRLRDMHTDCCGGCAESDVADIYGWGPATDAWSRVEAARFLLGDER